MFKLYSVLNYTLPETDYCNYLIRCASGLAKWAEALQPWEGPLITSTMSREITYHLRLGHGKRVLPISMIKLWLVYLVRFQLNSNPNALKASCRLIL